MILIQSYNTMTEAQTRYYDEGHKGYNTNVQYNPTLQAWIIIHYLVCDQNSMYFVIKWLYWLELMEQFPLHNTNFTCKNQWWRTKYNSLCYQIMNILNIEVSSNRESKNLFLKNDETHEQACNVIHVCSVIMYRVWYAMHSVQCIMYIVHCTMYLYYSINQHISSLYRS